ncbi:MAG: NUDIX domain-containing protein [Clostridia bacterium]|nr:NUDIX domain-containing protein [Clostridia bacterium]
MAELWDLYDENRNPLGRTVERGKHDGCAAWHTVVIVVVKNSNGEFLITRRAPEKPFGDRWEFTGGSVIAGETSEAGAIREAFEETGIDHTSSKRTLIKTIKKIWNDGAKGWHGDFDDIWLFEADFPIENIVLQKGETTDARWVSRNQLIELIEKDDFFNMKNIIATVLESKE